MGMTFSILSVKLPFAKTFLLGNLCANLVEFGHQRMEFTEVILENVLADVELFKCLAKVTHSFQRLCLSQVAHDPDVHLCNPLALKCSDRKIAFIWRQPHQRIQSHYTYLSTFVRHFCVLKGFLVPVHMHQRVCRIKKGFRWHQTDWIVTQHAIFV